MKKMFLFSPVFLFIAFLSAFIIALITTKDLVFIVPCCVCATGVILVIVLMCKRRLEYHIYDECLVIKQNGRILKYIKKEEIYSLKFIYDAYYKNLLMVLFKNQNHRYCIKINERNKDDIVFFFESIEKTDTDNWLYYFITFFSQVI